MFTIDSLKHVRDGSLCESITTRIETSCGRCKPYSECSVLYVNPLQQGLKHTEEEAMHAYNTRFFM